MIIQIDTEVIYLQTFFIKVLINLSAASDFPSLRVEFISTLLSCNHELIDLW